jgi:hypothetical protein
VNRAAALLVVLLALLGAGPAWGQAAARPGVDEATSVPVTSPQTEMRPPRFAPLPAASGVAAPTPASTLRSHSRTARNGSTVRAQPLVSVLIVVCIGVACLIPVRRRSAEQTRKPDYRRVNPQETRSKKVWDL